MASVGTVFPPPNFSTKFFSKSSSKKFQPRCDLDDHTENGVTKSTGEKAVDIGEVWRGRSSKGGQHTISVYKKLRHGWANLSHNTSHDNSCQGFKDDNMALLKCLALNALDLSAPASDILLKSRGYQWFQLSGHPDSFAPAGHGTIWKKRTGADNSERRVYEALSTDPVLRDLVPRYYREVEYRGERFIQLQDLLHNFDDPSVADIKLGTRTFMESEVQKTTARHDLYQKMIAVDPSAPTPEEHRLKAVTKLRYMQFREQQSSTCSQGFRIEAMKLRGSPPVTDLKKVKSRADVAVTLTLFLAGREDTRRRLLSRLLEIRAKLEQSEYFRTHEVVGSSLLMIHDDRQVGVWLIDFAKTYPIPAGQTVDHRSTWVQGNHEEGLLFGLDQLISVMEGIDCRQSCFSTPSGPPSSPS